MLSGRCLAHLLTVEALSWATAVLPGCEKPIAAAPSGPAGGPPPAPVVVAMSERRDVPLKYETIGTAKAFSVITVRPQLAGLVTEKFFTPGQYVKKGDLLYRMDSRPYEAELRRAEAELAQDEALAERAKRESDRRAELFKEQAGSKWESDQAEMTHRAAAARINLQRAMIESARLSIEYCQIRSPIDGFVGPTLTDAGNVVKANETTMVVLRQVTPIYVEMTVPQTYLERIRRAMSAGDVPLEARQAGDESAAPIVGKLLFMDNTVTEETGTITLRGKFDNEDRRLWPGQYLRASLVLETRKDAVLVPTAALQNGQKGPFVYVIDADQTARMALVKPGPVTGGQVLIEQGLEPGLRVVTEGHLRLRPGSKVQITSPSRPKGGDAMKSSS